MEYILNKTIEIIDRYLPQPDGEAIVCINGFENIEFYAKLAERISNTMQGKNLTYDIKLSSKKYNQLCSGSAFTSYAQIMRQKNWVASDESITRFRNMHNTNLLVLMGTESEEDKGGLLNCFSVTTDTIIAEMNGKYSVAFPYLLTSFSNEDVAIIDKLYHDLFELVPVDVCKLSNFADAQTPYISNIREFIEIFYSNLHIWGLPDRKYKLPSAKEISNKRNVLDLEQKFISRDMFKRLSNSKYAEYQKKLEKYAVEGGEFGPNWDGWNDQEIKSYDQLGDILMAHIRGEAVDKNLLLKTDFSIAENIIGLKLSHSKTTKNSIIKLKGSPLSIFTKAFLYSLINARDTGVVCVNVKFSSAELVCSYHDSDDVKENLANTWKNICRHVNGITDIINQRSWNLDSADVKVEIEPDNIFSPDCCTFYIDQGRIVPALANKTISKITFHTYLVDTDGLIVKDKSLKFQWEFLESSPWTYDFVDICTPSFVPKNASKFIPLSKLEDIKPLLFAKSNEEFFDLYGESKIDHSFNIVDFIDKNAGNNGSTYCAKFYKLGESFLGFVNEVRDHGFYYSLKEGPESATIKFLNEYTNTGEQLIKELIPGNLSWILDCYIHSFCIEESDAAVKFGKTDYAIVPPWHPATLQKIVDQKNFFLDGCAEWWNGIDINGKVSRKNVDDIVSNLEHMSSIQNAVDLFPSSNTNYFGSTAAFEDFSVYMKDGIQNDSRLMDIIRKDEVFDDDFKSNEFTQMNDNAQMISGIIDDYIRSFSIDNSLSLAFVNPTELQPIVSAIYNYTQDVRKKDPSAAININLKILVKPENKGGRNYLSYWMDEYFSQDSNVNIRIYLNEWKGISELKSLFSGNDDIIFMMDLLNVNEFNFIPDKRNEDISIRECRFPIVYRPAAISRTTASDRRRMELSQPQFSASYMHTQVVHYRNSMYEVPSNKYIAVREVSLDKEVQELIRDIHLKANWIVCIDSSMDGALLRSNGGVTNNEDYTVIGFSTGKGTYGQYNLTITTRKSLLVTIKNRLSTRLCQLFHWDNDQNEVAAELCINEAGKLDGISLFSAINQKDHNINEFMAYVLTSFREKNSGRNSALRIMIYLDSYKHWFYDGMEYAEDESASRPDFLLLEVMDNEDDILQLDASVIECKIAPYEMANAHKTKAVEQVRHGIKRLSALFDPNSNSIKRRYWYAQLYRALAFAQITFMDKDEKFNELSAKLRAILNGRFAVNWHGKVLGYWLDMPGDRELETEVNSDPIIIETDIPQSVIQNLLLNKDEKDEVQYVAIPSDLIASDEELDKRIKDRDKELMDTLNKLNDMRSKVDLTISDMRNNTAEKVTAQYSSDSRMSTGANYQEKPIEENKPVVETAQQENTPTGLSSADIRVLIGEDKLSNEVYWEFGNPLLANRHMLITGTSGQGKTYGVQTMLYELLKNNISAIVFDYTEGFRLDQLEKGFVDGLGDKIKQQIIYLTGVPINPFKRQEIEISGMSVPEKYADIAARIANIFKHVYDFGDQQFSVVFEAARKGLEKYHDDMNMKHFQELLEEEMDNNKAAQSVISKMTQFFHSIEFNESEDFDWGEILYGEDSHLYIFQLTSIDRVMQVIITELMLWDAWYYTKKYGSKEKPFVAVLDEAQNLSHKANSPSAAILTEGRKFGWSAWFATQSLKVLRDDEVVRLMQAATKLYFKPTEDEMTKISKQIDPTDGNLWIGSLKNLKKGQCIFVGDRVGNNGKFGSTKPTITTVKPFEERS